MLGDVIEHTHRSKFYFGMDDFQYPMGNIQMVGKYVVSTGFSPFYIGPNEKHSERHDSIGSRHHYAMSLSRTGEL